MKGYRIVDLSLPGMDGLEFLKRIQKDYPQIKKILITAWGNEQIKKKATILPCP